MWVGLHPSQPAMRARMQVKIFGGVRPRQVRFHPYSGRTQVRRLGNTTDPGLAERERLYLKQLANDPIKGEVELF